MVTTHTITVKPLHPLGGASRGGHKSYVGDYTSQRVDPGALIQLSPSLDVLYVDIVDGKTSRRVTLSGGTASTGLLQVSTANVTCNTGVAVFAVGK